MKLVRIVLCNLKGIALKEEVTVCTAGRYGKIFTVMVQGLREVTKMKQGDMTVRVDCFV